MSTLIRQFSLSYREGDHALLALDQVDLALEPGRVCVLVGESGSGKTSLGKALMGLLPDNAVLNGSIFVEGQEIVGLEEAALNRLRWSSVAMVFQGGAAVLNPVQRIAGQLAEPLIEHQGLTRKAAWKTAEDQLLGMGLDIGIARRYPRELSGGQVQRVLLAMATILNPKVLILDEPTSALDAMTKAFLLKIIAARRNRGTAVLLITHDLELAQTLGDELAVLYMGQIMETMPAGDILHHPQHPYSLALSRSYPGLEAVRDLGGIRGDAFYRLVHAHARDQGPGHSHAHLVVPDSVHEGGHAPPEGCLFHPRCTQALPACTHGTVPLLTAGGHQIRCLRGGIVEILKLSGVSKRYSRVQALCSVDMALKAGEVFCLVGETGSGKSTLAMIAAGSLRPDQGQREFQQRSMEDWFRQDPISLARQIGVIDQNPAEAVSHRLSVFEIVAEPLRIQKSGLNTDERRRRVLRALSEARLSTAPEFLKRYAHELNMGALQRICLARALVHDPLLLVADEPTSSLDPSVQAKILKMLLELQTDKGLTMLFVTHDIGLARKIGDRFGVMLAGRMIELGPAAGSETGCPFQNRCPDCLESCRQTFPGPSPAGNERHLVWCHRPCIRIGEGTAC